MGETSFSHRTIFFSHGILWGALISYYVLSHAIILDMLYDSRTIDPFGTLGLFPLHVPHRRRKGFNFYLTRDLQCVQLMSRKKVVARMSHCRV
jgi:hypothetical protein